MPTKTIEKYFFLGFLLIVTIFTLIIFQPFLGVIIVGASLAVVLHPLYLFFLKKVTRNTSWIAALLSLVIFLVVICGPLFGVGTLVFKQSQDAYVSIVGSGGTSPLLDRVGVAVNRHLPPGFKINPEELAGNFISFVSQNVSRIFTATLSTVFSLFLVLLTMFYFLKDGDRWRQSIIVISPLSDIDDIKILRKLEQAINGVVKCYLLVAILQGTLMGIGLAIFGVPHPALWGVLAGIASLVPTIGTALVAIPVIVYLLTTSSIGVAIGFTIWAVVLVGLIDNMLNPIVVSKNTDVPPLLILFSVLGGISLMGPVGILIGPLTVSLLYALVSIYRSTFHVESSL
jgi:predicted PurR-regulated permease PerM